MKRLGWATLALVGALATSRLLPPQPARAAGDDFSRFVDDYFEAQFRAQPTSGTEAGLHQYDGLLEDLSRSRIEARIAELKRFQARLGAFDRAELSFDESIDAQALDGDIRSGLQ